jgi:hypothetical protein
MSKLAGVLAGLLVPAFLLTATVVTPATAQDKAKAKMEKKAAGKVMIKEITKNDKVRVYEAILKPGDEAPSIERPFRVIRTLAAGAIQRTYPDGKKETLKYKAGEVRVQDRATYSAKNVGNTTVHLYIVELM